MYRDSFRSGSDLDDVFLIVSSEWRSLQHVDSSAELMDLCTSELLLFAHMETTLSWIITVVTS